MKIQHRICNNQSSCNFWSSLDAHVSGSFHLLENLLNGSMKRVPQILLNVVDVRDVAELHILAMTNEQATGQAIYCDGLWTN